MTARIVKPALAALLLSSIVAAGCRQVLGIGGPDVVGPPGANDAGPPEHDSAPDRTVMTSVDGSHETGSLPDAKSGGDASDAAALDGRSEADATDARSARDASDATVLDGSAIQVTALVAGGYHTCALYSNGTMKCWGGNQDGQLGDGTMTNQPMARAVSLSGIVAIGAGLRHTCAVLNNGSVWCWGDNQYGELGTGNEMSHQLPTHISGLTNARGITLAGYHSCALLMDGSVQCWGLDSQGELGELLDAGAQDAMTISPTPSPVPNLGPVTEIAAGGFHTCALSSTGSVQCWGANTKGELGNTTMTSSATPVSASNVDAAVMLSSGFYFTCALTTGGALQCWGCDKYGELGDGVMNTTRDTPEPVQQLGGAVSAVSAGSYHACALLANGAIQCWGENVFGQLGNGSLANSSVPVTVPGDSGARFVASGGDHTCAVLSNGVVECWGYNGSGEVGNGVMVDAAVPSPGPVMF